MPSSCSAFGCIARYNKLQDPTRTFHRFPKDEALKQEWVRRMRRENFTPTKYSLICSKHFREEDIDRTSQSVVRIRNGAVPRIFEAFPKHLQENHPPKRKASTNRTVTDNCNDSPVSVDVLPLQLSPNVPKEVESLRKENETLKQVKEEFGNGYDGTLKIEEIDVKEEAMESDQESSDKEDRQGGNRGAHFQSHSPDSQSKKDSQQGHIMEVKEELQNGYEGSLKSEEIDIKEDVMESDQELIESEQDPSDKEDRQGENRKTYFQLLFPDSQSKDSQQGHTIEVKEELGGGYVGALKREEIDIQEDLIESDEEPMQSDQEPLDKEDRQGENRGAHFQSYSPDSQSKEDLHQGHITEVKEDLGNGYDGYLKSEEIDIKEEPIEPMEELSNEEDFAQKLKRYSSVNRKTISLEEKLEIIMRSEKGESHKSIKDATGICLRIVGRIIRNKKSIFEEVKITAPKKVAIMMKQCNFEVERLLLIWLEDQNQRRIPLSLRAIQKKARRLHCALKSESGEESTSEQFVASKDWCNRFMALAYLHNLKVPNEAVRADEEAAKTFPTRLAEIIREGGYLPEQVFNVDETGLFWKRMPSCTYMSKEEKSATGHKVSRERLTLLLGGNASGDFKLKPLLVYLAENPSAFKGISKSQLPVIWKSNQKAWVTLHIFEDWFTDNFVPSVKEYCIKKNLPFKVLLVLGNGPGHPSQLNYMHPNVKVVYLPPNTTSILQPVDQGVMASFKAYYLQWVMNNAFKAIESNKELTFKEFWKSYNILEAVKNIAGAWDEVQQTSMNGAWKKLCPQFVNDLIGFEEFKTLELQSVTNKIVGVSKELHLETDANDVNELLESHGEELSEEDLIHLEKQMIEEEEEAPPVAEPTLLIDKGLSEAFFHMEKAMALFEAVDLNMERYTKILGEVMYGLTFYRETLEEDEKEKIQTYIKKHFPTPYTMPEVRIGPIPGTSGMQSEVDSKGLMSTNLLLKNAVTKAPRVRCPCPNCQDGKKKKNVHNCHIPGCNKVYGKTSHLRAHLRWHSGDRPYVCSQLFCNKSFCRSDELTRHERVHSREKMFQCLVCNKYFYRSDHFSRHVMTHK